MLSAPAAFQTVQLARSARLPMLTQPASAREMALEGVRQRNTFLDALFYDVGVVSHDEAVSISPWLAAEGALIIVPPSGGEPLTLCPTVDDFVKAGGAKVRTLAIAGVGSSALGSTAFARNVADATGERVAAVVSGYGLADVAAEALGGFFWFGAINGVRHLFHHFDYFLETGRNATTAAERRLADASPIRRSQDTATVLQLFKDARFAFDLLIGHSKGNLVLSEALYELRNDDEKALARHAERARIVTVSARIAMPNAFSGIIDVMGEWDWFGGLNSRPDIPADIVVPAAWHHTNTDIPAHLPVTRTLQGIFRP